MIDDEFKLSDELLAMADSAASALADMGEDYALEATIEAEQLVVLASKLADSNAQEGFSEAVEGIFSLAHNFKGQGKTFGYDLVTIIGKVLCELTRAVNKPSRSDIPSIAKLSAAIYTVLSKRIDGTGGKKGAALCADLGIAIS